MAGTPVVFVHGLWLHADSWGNWVELFREAGYEPIAPGWPGDGDTVAETRSNSEAVAGYGVDDIVEHYAQAVGKLSAKPIVIGHSFGGLIVQRLLCAGSRRGGRGDRPRSDQGRRLSAAVGSAGRVDRAQEPAQPEARRRADAAAVPLRVRQRHLGCGVGASSSSAGRSRRPAGRCSRPLRRTCRCIHPRRSTPATRRAGRC